MRLSSFPQNKEKDINGGVVVVWMCPDLSVLSCPPVVQEVQTVVGRPPDTELLLMSPSVCGCARSSSSSNILSSTLSGQETAEEEQHKSTKPEGGSDDRSRLGLHSRFVPGRKSFMLKTK